jgi:hypothetical protein
MAFSLNGIGVTIAKSPVLWDKWCLNACELFDRSVSPPGQHKGDAMDLGRDFEKATKRSLLLVGAVCGAFGIGLVLFAISRIDSHATRRPPYVPVSSIGERDPVEGVAVFKGADVARELDAEELVIGVVVNGLARAYPVNMLHGEGQEVINDEIGDIPVVITWGTLCFNARVYQRRLANDTLTFSEIGNTWNNSLVMMDTTTKSHWSQLLGEAVIGARKGDALIGVPCDVLTWAGWMARHPETTVISRESTSQEYTGSLLEESTDLVYGAVLDGKAVHWPLPTLLAGGGASCVFNGTPLLLLVDPVSKSVRLYPRMMEGNSLHFEPGGGGLIREVKSKSVWEPTQFECIEGVWKGRQLQPIVGTLSRADDWSVFYPGSLEITVPRSGE